MSTVQKVSQNRDNCQSKQFRQHNNTVAGEITRRLAAEENKMFERKWCVHHYFVQLSIINYK